MTTFEPVASPLNKEVIRKTIDPVAPTAAKAVSPANWKVEKLG